MTFEEARAQFPVLERLAYLNAGTFGPLTRATVDAMGAQLRRELEGGRAGPEYFESMLGLRTRVREKLAAVIEVDAEQLALTSSTTEGCRIVLLGLGLRPDDEVVTTDSEHPGLIGPLRASGVRIRTAQLHGRPAAAARDAVLAEVGPRTRLLAVSHVLWTTGHVVPVRELRSETGLPILVDGAQAAGAIPVDANGVDFYTVSAQKWLCGPDACGALYVADPERLRVAGPSYFSYEPGTEYELRAGGRRFDPGWTPTAALAGLEAALDGAPKWRYARAAALAARCRERLAERVDVVTEPGHGTLVSFRVDGETEPLVQRLYARGVVVRDLPGTGLVRASCGWWTSDADLDRLVEGLADA